VIGGLIQRDGAITSWIGFLQDEAKP